jgi:cysteine desulfurase
MNKPDIIYMDYHATTPVDPAVLEAMLPYFNGKFGNAASIDHFFGNEAQRAVEESRETIARLIGADDSQEVIFTSGATESDNIALVGITEAYSHKGNHIISSATEHKAVLDTLDYLTTRGFKSTILPVDKVGMINPDDVESAITDQTILISIMMANNEIGTIQPVREIGQVARDHEIFFHTDAAQAVGHIPVDVNSSNIDLMSFTAHKLYGPKGIGALFARRKRPRVKPAPVIHGGGHERGIRSGTLNVPAIVGFAKAMEIAAENMDREEVTLRQWTEYMFSEFQQHIRGVERNGHPLNRLAHNLNVYLPGVESKSLMMELATQVAFSSGSACTSAKIEPSHVIQALGMHADRAHSSVRFGLGRFTTLSEVNVATDRVIQTVSRLKNIFV